MGSESCLLAVSISAATGWRQSKGVNRSDVRAHELWDSRVEVRLLPVLIKSFIILEWLTCFLRIEKHEQGNCQASAFYRFTNISFWLVACLYSKSLRKTRCFLLRRNPWELSLLSLDTEIAQTQELYFSAEAKFIWKSPHFCRKREVPKAFIWEENKPPHILALPCWMTLKATGRETKQIEVELCCLLIRGSSILLLRQVISVPDFNQDFSLLAMAHKKRRSGSFTH